MEKHFIQNIDYVNNQYFIKGNILNSNFSKSDNIKLLELINRIDTIASFLINSSSQNYDKKFNEYAGECIDQIFRLLAERSKGDLELKETLLSIHSEAIKLVKKHIRIFSENNDYDTEKVLNSLGSKSKDYIDSLNEQGYLEFSFDLTPEFLSWSHQQLDKARKTYENESDWRGGNSYDINSEEYKYIEKFIRDNNITEIISEYKKMDMQLYYAAWDYSHNRQKWFRNNHEYNYLSPTNYYHFDADPDVAKMLIYLSDVGEGDGPFKFVKGSNTMPRSIYLTYIFYAIDTLVSPKFKKSDNLYGRGLFLYRKDFLLKFPECFMGSTHFGDDVIDGSDLSHYLLNNTTTFTRKKGSAVLFDGFSGIHAGGNAFTGERLAIQVAFKRKKSIDQNRPKTTFSEHAVKFAVKFLGPIKRRLVGSSKK